MVHLKPMTGNKAFAYGVKLSRVQVIAAYPITPQTTVVEYLSDFANNGEINDGKCEYIRSEGEFGMMGEAIGAAQTGARTFASTCSAGFAYGFQGIVSAPGLRLGNLHMAVINRSMGVPGTLQADHSDALTVRDWGWIQFFCESHQELTDTVIQAYKIGEDRRVLMPTMAGGEGYYLSYTTDLVDLPSQEAVDAFLPTYKPIGKLDPKEPMLMGMGGDPMGQFKAQQEATDRAEAVIKEVNKGYKEHFGRSYGNGLIEEYKMDGAEVALVAMGSYVGNARAAVDILRSEGKKVGLVKIRAYRPFPTQDFRRIAENVKAFVAVSRHVTLGGPGNPVGGEIKAALYDMDERPLVQDVVSGLVGMEIGVNDFRILAQDGIDGVAKGRFANPVVWYPDITVELSYDVPPMKEETKSTIVYPATSVCQGCGMSLVHRTLYETVGRNMVMASTSGCGGWAGAHTIPTASGGSAGLLPGGAAVATGVKRGLDVQGKDAHVVLVSGDGSFGDMGFMSGSGAAERNENILMVVYDNEAYMNTGIQRSGSTPYLAWTTTTPVGSVVRGKEHKKKDLPRIMAAHGIPYVATANVAYMPDFTKKVKKALTIKGCKYIHVYSPCPTGHRYPSEQAITVSRLATQSGMWPLYEIEDGKLKFTVKPKERIPVADYLKTQGRFRHMTDKEIEEYQKMINKDFETLEALEKSEARV